MRGQTICFLSGLSPNWNRSPKKVQHAKITHTHTSGTNFQAEFITISRGSHTNQRKRQKMVGLGLGFENISDESFPLRVDALLSVCLLLFPPVLENMKNKAAPTSVRDGGGWPSFYTRCGTYYRASEEGRVTAVRTSLPSMLLPCVSRGLGLQPALPPYVTLSGRRCC